MFRPIRMFQLGTLLCLVAGCATGGTPHNQNGAQPGTAAAAHAAQPGQVPSATTGTAPDTLPPLPQPPIVPPPISAGESTPGPMGFTQDNGKLNPDIQAYAAEVARTRNIPQQTVEALLREARYDETVARLMSPAKTRVRRSWSTYRSRFVEPVRIKAGLQFWQAHQQQLARTEQAYGVPASIIVAIIGVETIYGRYTGDFRVLDALATLGFRYPDPSRPERSQLFRDQLADLAQLHHEEQLDARTVQGSFAGAMGLPQFMPGSLMRFAVDGDGDGVIDLHDSTADAIASVAAFLRLHGWVPGLPVFAPVQLPPQPDALVKGGIDPTLDWNTLRDHGATLLPGVQDTTWQHHPLGVIDLRDEPRGTVEYRTGTPNFFAITHYNRSYFYATSVFELARELSRQMGRPAPS
ncbi:MAG TPA: lytic murein transglycosylase B [Burkholderiaceae bacterium]|nr:lytic murein transglycosylase B [Burkholderiaceae bacterium]